MESLFVFWFICAVVTGIVASSRGRSGFGWFLLGCLISFLALILVALLPSKKTPPQTAATTYVGGEIATPETHVRCPECKGLVHKEARKCMHCGVTLIPASEQPARDPNALVDSGYVAPPVPDEETRRAFDSKMPAYSVGERMGQWMRGRRR